MPSKAASNSSLRMGERPSFSLKAAATFGLLFLNLPLAFILL
jgi:hypothetical protein